MLLAALLAAVLAAPALASASEFVAVDTPELRLPELRPTLDWQPVADVPDLRERAVVVDGEVDAATLRQTLDTLYIRRKMLTAHQVLAVTAASTIVATEIVGMINRVALQTGNIRRSELEPLLGLHRGLAATAMGTYWGAGILAWTMPSPSGRREHKGISEWKDTRDLHIILSIIHNIAMGTVIATGILQANVVSPEDWEPLIVAHNISGFVAAGFVFTAAIVIGRK
jgi:hypothetical protein